MEIPFSKKIDLLPPPIRPYLFDVNKIINNYIGFENIYSIILFGSYARGEYTATSDVDLLIIIKDEFFNAQSKEFFRKLERIFLGVEYKNKLKFQRKNFIGGFLISMEKTTGMFVSHFVCNQSAWEKKSFHEIFGVSKFMAFLLAPGKIVLKNMGNSYITLYGEDVYSLLEIKIKIGQLLKSLLMNEVLAICTLILYPFWRNSIKYCMESFKWSIRNSYLYVYDKPASIWNIIRFFENRAIKPEVFDKFITIRKQKNQKDSHFALRNPYYILKIHFTAIKYRKIHF